MLVLLIFKCCNVFFTHLREISRKGTTFFAHMQFFLHICSKNDDLWLYPRKF